jgi:hypothetical protein
MDYRIEKYNDNELQTDSIANKNRKLFANVLPNEQVPNKDPFTDVLPNMKTDFRTKSSTPSEADDDASEPLSGSKITFAYGGDKGVNEKQWGSS